MGGIYVRLRELGPRGLNLLNCASYFEVNNLFNLLYSKSTKLRSRLLL